MKHDFLLVNPASSYTKKGNHVTSERWVKHLENLGHSVTVIPSYSGEEAEAVISLHAKKSAESIERFKKDYPDRPLVLALTGTDLYRDLDSSKKAQKSLDLADHFIVLQPKALDKLPEECRDKTHVIYQSLDNVPETGARPISADPDDFIVLTIAHIREVKDPLRVAYAVRELPQTSSVKAYLLGGVLEENLGDKASEEAETNDRFNLLGENDRRYTLQLLKGADLMVIPSKLEGGANVVTEAIACGTPILASDIDGNRGLLGDYSGYFPVGNEKRLRQKILRCEQDDDYYGNLMEQIRSLKSLADPDRERRNWQELIDSLGLQ